MQTQTFSKSIYADLARFAAAGLATGVIAAALMAASVFAMAQAHAADIVPGEVSRLMQHAGPAWVAHAANVNECQA
jgi:hypothetical protein